MGFYKGVSASVFTVSLISSVSFGTYRNFLCNICKLRYGTADAKPSGLDVSLAGGAAGAVRVGSKVQKHNRRSWGTWGWESTDVFCSALSRRKVCFLVRSCPASLAKENKTKRKKNNLGSKVSK